MENYNLPPISKKVCEDIIEVLNNLKHTRLDNEMQGVDKLIVTNDWIHNLLSKYHVNYIISGPILGFRYHENDFLNWHRDDMYSKTASLTGGVFLNIDYKGGLFEFKDGTIQPQILGQPFTITRTILHRVSPVLSGTRFSLHYKLLKKVKDKI